MPPCTHHLDAYSSVLSVVPGDRLWLHVSTSLKAYDITVARIGASRNEVWRKDRLPGREHAVPDNASSHGCAWPVACEIPIALHWASGYYVIALRGTTPAGNLVETEASFVVRPLHPGLNCRILLHRTTNTDNAYNNFGGATLYSGPSGPGRRVSFDRPFTGYKPEGNFLFSLDGDPSDSLNTGAMPDALLEALHQQGIATTPYRYLVPRNTERSWHLIDASLCLSLVQQEDRLDVYDAFTVVGSCWHRWEAPFVRWAESAGYEFDYAVNSDLEFRPEILDAYHLVLSVGHDEYWSKPMRDHLEAFVAAGGNVAFFSGNNLWWQVRSENRGRALVCCKDPAEDPLFGDGKHDRLSTLWCHHLIGRPENHLTGVSFAYGGYHGFFDQYRDGPDGYTVHRPKHWLFEGTGLQRGDRFGEKNRIVGYECDGCDMIWHDGLPIPTHRDGTPENFSILATGDAALSRADGSLELASQAIFGASGELLPQPGAAVLGSYTRGGTVVTVGSTDWSSGLRGDDSMVTKITANVLNRLG